MKTQSRNIVIALGIVVLASGCATPLEIRKQSTATAAQIGTITSEITRYAASEKRAAQARANRVLALHAEMDTLEQRRRLRMTLKHQGQLKSLFSAIDAAEVARLKRAKQRTALETTVNKSVKTFTVPSAPLRESQKALADLSKEAKLKEKFSFFKAFAKLVAKDFKEQRKKSEEVADKADKESKDMAKGTTVKAAEVK